VPAEVRSDPNRPCASVDAPAALAEAARICALRGARLTPLRRMVFELLLNSHTPVTAYELLDALKIRRRRSIAPQTIYRALDFLCRQRFALRLETRKAYIASADPSARFTQVLFICDACGQTCAIEDKHLQQRLSSDASAAGFKILREVVEVDGLCRMCAGEAQGARSLNRAPGGETGRDRGG
jgi:Fur family zinc uptake transcriptional regulator